MTDHVLETIAGVDLKIDSNTKAFYANLPSGTLVRRKTFEGLKKSVVKTMGIGQEKDVKKAGWQVIFRRGVNTTSGTLTGRTEIRKQYPGSSYGIKTKHYEVVLEDGKSAWVRSLDLKVGSKENAQKIREISARIDNLSNKIRDERAAVQAIWNEMQNI